MEDQSTVVALLREIRDRQHEQVALQAQSIELQRAHFALAQSQIERVERINDRAEAIQARADAMGKLALWVLVPGLALAIAALLWTIFVRLVDA